MKLLNAIMTDSASQKQNHHRCLAYVYIAIQCLIESPFTLHHKHQNNPNFTITCLNETHESVKGKYNPCTMQWIWSMLGVVDETDLYATYCIYRTFNTRFQTSIGSRKSSILPGF